MCCCCCCCLRSLCSDITCNESYPSLGFSLLLHGYGSKRTILRSFAEFLEQKDPSTRPQKSNGCAGSSNTLSKSRDAAGVPASERPVVTVDCVGWNTNVMKEVDRRSLSIRCFCVSLCVCVCEWRLISPYSHSCSLNSSSTYLETVVASVPVLQITCACLKRSVTWLLVPFQLRSDHFRSSRSSRLHPLCASFQTGLSMKIFL